jgi:nucleoside-diphosphate-sugar epimerase
MSVHRVVLTGASGVLGRSILKQLVDRKDASVLALYRKSLPLEGVANIQHRVVDFSRPDEVDGLLLEFRPTVLIHSAATGMQVPRPGHAALREVNVELPVRLAEAASRIENCSFVQVSSGLAYRNQGRPLREDDPLGTDHAYGASKAEAEERLQAMARKTLPLIIVRPFSFTGEGDFGARLFPSLLRSAAAQQPFEMSSGNQVRDHSSADDIAQGIIAAAFQAIPNSSEPPVFNLGAGDTRTLRELVEAVIDQLGLKVDVRFGARSKGAHEPMFMVADPTRAQTELHWNRRENIAHAVWRLARTSLPSLYIEEPPRHP